MMALRNRSRWFSTILLVTGILALIGTVDLARQGSAWAGSLLNSTSDKAGPSSTQSTQERTPVYSFDQDADGDGLSNAWEEIFGSDPLKKDTDQDGYNDKEEVDNAYDPINPGDARLEQRQAENFSIDYYVWAKKKKIENPNPEDLEKIRQFAEENNSLALKQFNLKKVKTKPNPNQALKQYLTNLNAVDFPVASFNYQALAVSYSERSESQLKDLINRVDLALTDLKTLRPPQKAAKVQQNYVTILKNFRSFIKDLKRARRDPVLIKINLLRSGRLIRLAQETDRIKQSLILN